MKKYLFILICILITIFFTACSISSEMENPSREEHTDSVSTTENDTTLSSKTEEDKTISKLYLNYNGITVDINTDDAGIGELLEAKKKATVPQTPLNTELAKIIAVYNDNTEKLFGTIYIGDDGAYYLKFSDSELEGTAYKMADSSFVEGLF